MENDKTLNIRFHIPKEVYDKVIRVQGMLSMHENRKVSMSEAYTRTMDRGAIELLKQAKR